MHATIALSRANGQQYAIAEACSGVLCSHVRHIRLKVASCAHNTPDTSGVMRLTVTICSGRLLPSPQLLEQRSDTREVVGAKARPAGGDHVEGNRIRQIRPFSWHSADATVVVLEPDAVSVLAAALINQDEGASTPRVEGVCDDHPACRIVGTGCILL